MRKKITARYDAENNVLRLVEPLEGVANEEKVTVEVETAAVATKAGPPWAHLRGTLSKEAGDEMARIIAEEFPLVDPVPGYKWP